MQTIILSIKQNHKIILQVAFGLLFVALGIYFIKHEVGELSNVRSTLVSANPYWVLSGIFLMFVFVIVQGLMYQKSFEAIHEKIRLSTGIILYLKRNLVSVFLPAGLVTNLLFFNESVERKEGINKTQTYFASSIFSICSILSGIIVGIPALVWLLFKQSLSGKLIIGVLLVTLLLGLVIFSVVSIVRKGWLFHFLEKRAPVFTKVLNEMGQQAFSRNKFLMVTGLSIAIELIGISHLYIAVQALGGTPTLAMAAIGYAIVLLLLMTSPFLRGIGAVEVALTYALTLFGLSTVMAVSIAFLFRFFEFWAVLLMGFLAMVAQRDNLVLRILPALLLFTLGIVNIVSGITPALPERLESLSQLLPLETIQASVWLVMLSGIILLATSIYLVRGFRNAWIIALVLSGLSFIAHITKGIDWEEAIVAGVTLGSLVYQRHQYFIKPDLKLARRSLFPGLVAVTGVILFGTIAFWYLSPHHFNIDFSLWRSFQASLSAFLLLNRDLHPVTSFGKQLLNGMNLLGAVTIIYLVFLFFRPLILRPATSYDEELLRARELVKKYGKSNLDYFKTYYDKKYWFSEDPEGFVAFKTERNHAIVLENPVCKDEASLIKIIGAFDNYCRQNGFHTAYYRVPETDKPVYERLQKKFLPIGEMAVMNLEAWTMSGSDRRALRNEVNKMTKLGFSFQVNPPPQKDAFLQQLEAVSNNWLNDLQRSELVFSQGLFDVNELKNQTILTVENPEERIVGFINLIPDSTAGEANFDLMRKTKDAPGGTMDFLFVNMFEYLRNNGFKNCNLGMVPLSGIHEPENLTERAIKLAYERIRQFGHYKSLRSYKEKFDPSWQMMYLVYDTSYDLIYLVNALERIFKP
jgi:phosphatidylglycerol lysyltransferase